MLGIYFGMFRLGFAPLALRVFRSMRRDSALIRGSTPAKAAAPCEVPTDWAESEGPAIGGGASEATGLVWAGFGLHMIGLRESEHCLRVVTADIAGR